MKKIASNGFVMGALLFGAVACGQNQSAVDEAQETNEQQAEGTAMEDMKTDLSDFMTEAASGGMMEVQLGQLAQEKAQSQDVKNFGQMMVTDHSKANDKLKALAQQKSIVLPDSMGQEAMEHVNDLRDKTGAEFDRAYMDLMVNDHQKDIDMFQNAAQNLEDPDVKSFASSTVPTLQKHLDRAKEINQGMDK